MFVACGLNHKTAPIDVREKVALPVSTQNTVLNRLVGLPAVNEAAILSTCNRTEIYCDTNDPLSILPWLAKEQEVSLDVIAPHFYIHHEHHGIRHTLRVASGLDSMMLGEPQILGQMKQAYQHACHAGTIKSSLRQVFQYVFNASKRIRNLSGIGNNPVSIAFAAVQLIGQRFVDFNSLNVFIIGSGEIASLVAKYLHKQGASHFMVASRSHENAKLLAQTFTGKALTISDIPQYLPQADVVISATACPLPFITKNLVEQAMNNRHQMPMFFLDLAVPRDIEVNIKELPGVDLYNIDDLKTMTEKGMDERRNAALQAERLIDFELENYIRWHRSLRAKEIICNYRSQMQEMAQQELQRAMQKLAAGHCQYTILSEFSERLVKKLTHAPTVGLRQAAWDNRQDLLDLVQYLFNTSTNLPSYEKVT
ncbi:glutamyl-tRNA reductase [Legionella nagasakiensis]|uniref:glutamyl-tRNA reductase n=1 Tax=Legionella nagasakiensis TaxID=535290 RepID=UPI001056CB84|nr:glutamyl-tRNA reductase [Legionella nagasakiensis]